MSGSLGEYLAYALKHSPETRAAFERWRSTRFMISREGRLPEPSISFGYFLRSVETRVGPQRYKIGVSQTFPWPTKLSAGESAAAERAKAAAMMVDAQVLAIRRDVAEEYWTLWLVNEEQRLNSEHDVVLEALAGSVRGRLRTGAASLADLSQVDLSIARHHDHRGTHEQAARKSSAKLRAAIGASAAAEVLPASDTPPSGLPVASDAELAEQIRMHPRIGQSLYLAASEKARAKAQAADRYPRFKVGLDLIGTGDAAMAGVEGSGKDALVVSGGLSIPLWAASYSDAEHAARAAARSHEAMAEASIRRAEEMLASSLADVRDSQRRIELNENTLMPQAGTTFQAVLGGYLTGRLSVAEVIIAQSDLIELKIEHARARAQRAKAWANLEFIVGSELDVKGGAQ